MVDLPLYAFGVWILYRSVLGFYHGQYVGMDFLVNAALLAGAWLWLGRTLVRAGLKHRATRLISSVRTQMTHRFSQMMDRALVPTAQAVDEQQAALDRLAQLEGTWRRRLENSDGPTS